MSIALVQGEEWRDWNIKEVRSTYKPPPVPSDAETYSVFSFKWTSVEYTPAELLDKFQKYTPFLVMTTQGYMGRDEMMNTVASDEIYWLKGVIKKDRVVVVNDYNAYFTVPVNCSQPIVALKDGKKVGSKTTIRKLLKEGLHKTFMFVGDKKQYVYLGADTGENVKFGALTIVDRYDERYLMGHTLSSGRLYHETSIIPAYMPVTLVIAAAMSTGDHVHFYRTMLDMYKFSISVPKEVAFPMYIKHCEDIMMFGRKPTEGDYDIVAPVRYVTFDKAHAIRHAKDVHIYTTLDNEESHSSPVGMSPKCEVKKATADVAVGQPEWDEAGVLALPIDADIDKVRAATVRQSNIAQRSRFGYHVVDVEPLDVLAELIEVLKSGVIPRTTSVKMRDVNLGVDVKLPRTRHAPAAESDRRRHLTEKVGRGRVSNTPSLEPPPSPPPPRPTKKPQKPLLADSSSHVKPLPKWPEGAQNPKQTVSVSGRNCSGGISAMEDIPEDISGLSSQGIGQCLELLRLSKYRRKFEEEQVDGRLLVELDEDVLQTDFGFSRFEALKLVRFAKGWRPKSRSLACESIL